MKQSKGHQGFVGRKALFDHPGRRGMPEALPKFTNESNALNKTKSLAPGQPSTLMAKKPTPKIQRIASGLKKAAIKWPK
jgi:hypothetical protein